MNKLCRDMILSYKITQHTKIIFIQNFCTIQMQLLQRESVYNREKGRDLLPRPFSNCEVTLICRYITPRAYLDKKVNAYVFVPYEFPTKRWFTIFRV